MFENGGIGSFLWENESWAFSNLDHSSEKSRTKVIDFNVVAPASFSQSSLPMLSIGGNKRVAETSGGGGEMMTTEQEGHHTYTERERRKKMKTMFDTLQALIPHLPSKADKTMIVDEAVNHIQNLQQTLQFLENQKMERLKTLATIAGEKATAGAGEATETTREAFMADFTPQLPPPMTTPRLMTPPPSGVAAFKTWTSPNVALNVCGHDTHISVSVCCAAKPAGLFSNICCVLDKYSIEVVSAHVSSDHSRCMYMIHARVPSDVVGEFAAEEMYKQAAVEITALCNTLYP